MNINFPNAVRPPDRQSIRGPVHQTSQVMAALFSPGDRVELQCRIPRRDLARLNVAAAEVPERAADLHVEHFERRVSLSVSVLPPLPDDITPGLAPTTSFLPPDISVLVVTFAAQPDLVDKLQHFDLRPNVIIDAGTTIDAAWRLAEVIDRVEFQQLGSAIRGLFGQAQDGRAGATEIVLPGFQPLSSTGGGRSLVGDVHDYSYALRNLRFLLERNTK